MKKLLFSICLITCIIAPSVLAFNVEQLVANMESYKIEVDGHEKQCVEPIVSIEDKAYLPLRAMAYMMGFDVQWMEEENKISIKSPPNFKSNNENDTLYPFVQNGQYGYMNQNGEIVIEPQFYYAYEFSDGLAVVRTRSSVGKNYGYINKKGEFVIPYKYSNAGQFKNGIAPVEETDPSNGVRFAKYININDEIVFSQLWFTIGRFYEGFALAKYSRIDKWTYVNRLGEQATNLFFDSAYPFSNGFASVENNGKWGVINASFDLVINYQYEELGSFEEGFLPAKKNGYWGVLNTKGELVIDFQYQDMLDYSEGLFAVKKDGLWGYINAKNQVVIPFKFKIAKLFQNGIATVAKSDDEWGVIDKSGKYIINPNFNYLEICENNLLKVINDDNSFYYITLSGENIKPF